jgi:hypothetical protein
LVRVAGCVTNWLRHLLGKEDSTAITITGETTRSAIKMSKDATALLEALKGMSESVSHDATSLCDIGSCIKQIEEALTDDGADVVESGLPRVRVIGEVMTAMKYSAPTSESSEATSQLDKALFLLDQTIMVSLDAIVVDLAAKALHTELPNSPDDLTQLRIGGVLASAVGDVVQEFPPHCAAVAIHRAAVDLAGMLDNTRISKQIPLPPSLTPLASEDLLRKRLGQRLIIAERVRGIDPKHVSALKLEDATNTFIAEVDTNAHQMIGDLASKGKFLRSEVSKFEPILAACEAWQFTAVEWMYLPECQERVQEFANVIMGCDDFCIWYGNHKNNLDKLGEVLTP